MQRKPFDHYSPHDVTSDLPANLVNDPNSWIFVKLNVVVQLE